jgi:hypothetical protein
MMASDAGISGRVSSCAERGYVPTMVATNEGTSLMSREAALAVRAMANVANDIIAL